MTKIQKVQFKKKLKKKVQKLIEMVHSEDMRGDLHSWTDCSVNEAIEGSSGIHESWSVGVCVCVCVCVCVYEIKSRVLLGVPFELIKGGLVATSWIRSDDESWLKSSTTPLSGSTGTKHRSRTLKTTRCLLRWGSVAFRTILTVPAIS